MVHIIKLCVGAASAADLRAHQRRQIDQNQKAGRPALPVCATRAWPKRRDEILDGGSLYWVIKGVICVRQPILAIDEVHDEHGVRCGFWLDPHPIETRPAPRRAFQGWRYLDPKDAPGDLKKRSGGETLPMELRLKLVELGAW